MWAKQSTAATLIVGPILDSTGAEYASAVIGDLSISKNGGTLTALAAAATLTVIANGQYTLVMTTGNLDTLGRLQITVNKSTYQMPTVGLVVVPAMVFDSMVLGTDVLQGDVTQFSGTAITAAAGIPEVKVASIAANAVNASALATDAVTEIQSGLATQTSVDDLPTNAELATALGTADDAVLAAIATVQSDTNDIQTRLPAALESGRIAAVLDSAATAALVDLIWDEPLTGATHNVATSSGKRLRQTTAFQQIDSTVIDASATTTTFVTGLTSAVDDFYNDSMLVFTDGALAGQVRAILDYVGATKTIILEEALTSAPVNGVAFAIVSLHIHPVSQIQSGLATSAALTAAKTILDKVDTGLAVDGAVYQFTSNMLELGPSGGGGGDATLAKQTEILAAIQGSEVIQVASPNVSGNLVLTQGDDYDGVANPKASWTVTTDYTSGWTVRLTIRSATDAVIYTATGSVVSSTVVAVTIAAPTGLTMTGCPGQWQGKFDVELTHSSGKKKTIALGTCYINEDQTR
jgi:hypothetical protein